MAFPAHRDVSTGLLLGAPRLLGMKGAGAQPLGADFATLPLLWTVRPPTSGVSYPVPIDCCS